MGKKRVTVNADPLAPARTTADWEAQGWAIESEPLTAAPRLEATVSVRFDPESALLLRRAARMKVVTKSQFVRQATLQDARKTIDETQLPATMWVPPQEDLASTSGSETVRVSGKPAQPVTTTRATKDLGF
jgi:hypothetical protein